MSDTAAVLFERLIDYAALFPPARREMPQAVAGYRAARQGPTGWMLGRFLCPAGRLDQLAAAGPDREWELAVVLSPEDDEWGAVVKAEVERVAAYPGPGHVRAIEVPLPANAGKPEKILSEALETVDGAGLGDVELFLEVPGAPWGETAGGETVGVLEATAAAGRSLPSGLARPPGVKLRCGGPKRDSFPSDNTIATFIATCRRLGLRFKATAGLHHPFRVLDPETGALQHGFVNLLAATAVPAAVGPSAVPAEEPPAEELAPIIAERDPEAFEIDSGGLGWRGQRAGAKALARARGLFTAYGSCSFAEPVEELAAHRILPAELAVLPTDA